jgi:hypothetical protein
MPATYLNTSTLSAAIGAGDNDFAVGSTSNIAVGNLLVIRKEVVKVQEIPVSGRVRVMRGFGGTEARAHASGTRFFIGAGEKFKAIKESLTALVGDSGSYPDYMLPGQRAEDGQGNIYVLCDLTATAYGGSTVAISNDGLFTCTPLKGGTHQGSVGLLVEPGTSDQYVWVQVYGYSSYAQSKSATTGVTSAYIATATTTVSTPDVGLEPLAAVTTASFYPIHGMFIVGAGSSAVTSATSSTGYYVPVFLNFPYINARLQSDETSNS